MREPTANIEASELEGVGFEAERTGWCVGPRVRIDVVDTTEDVCTTSPAVTSPVLTAVWNSGLFKDASTEVAAVLADVDAMVNLTDQV